MPLRGGGRRLMANTILNFHFDYLNTSLMASHCLGSFFSAILSSRIQIKGKNAHLSSILLLFLNSGQVREGKGKHSNNQSQKTKHYFSPEKFTAKSSLRKSQFVSPLSSLLIRKGFRIAPHLCVNITFRKISPLFSCYSLGHRFH